jgi:hypothetical protein
VSGTVQLYVRDFAVFEYKKDARKNAMGSERFG